MKTIEIELTDWQFECLEKIVENAEKQKDNEGKEVTKELILGQACKRFIGDVSGKLIAQD